MQWGSYYPLFYLTVQIMTSRKNRKSLNEYRYLNLILLSLQEVTICQRLRLFHSSNVIAITSHVHRSECNYVMSKEIKPLQFYLLCLHAPALNTVCKALKQFFPIFVSLLNVIHRFYSILLFRRVI